VENQEQIVFQRPGGPLPDPPQADQLHPPVARSAGSTERTGHGLTSPIRSTRLVTSRAGGRST
jgi:hypothetical protein